MRRKVFCEMCGKTIDTERASLVWFHLKGSEPFIACTQFCFDYKRATAQAGGTHCFSREASAFSEMDRLYFLQEEYAVPTPVVVSLALKLGLLRKSGREASK